ncbi:serine-rich adhesin for platelets-like [Heterodontus francisci]|uniref:serine-rich adhesin for platelets-like n=1 Tax=Heterodontus francisci TaxID=7792 RepID=UPI00355C4BDB
MKTLCFLKACSSIPTQQLCVNEDRSQALDRTVQQQTQSQKLENATVEREEFAPFGVSTPVANAAGGGFQNTPDISAVVSDAANYHEQKKAKQNSGLTLVSGVNVKICSSIQTNNVPSESSSTKPFDEPFFEDIKLYESEVKKKLQKYSAYLVLCDKERLSKIQSLEKLSRTDRKAFYCRLKKYDKYYERYQNELGLDKCCSAIVSKSHDVAYSYNSTAKSCSCVLTHGSGSSSCSTELTISDTASCLSESKGREHTLVDSKGIKDKSVGDLQSFTAVVNNRLCDVSCVEGEILHRAEDVTAERFVVTGENIPETSNTVGGLKKDPQSSFDNEATSMNEDVSVVTKSQMQVASSSVTSNEHTEVTNQSVQLNFFSVVDHSSDQKVVNTEITDRCEVPAVMEISEGSRNVGLNEEIVVTEEIQSSWENGELSEAEDRLFPNFQLEEVQMSVTSSKYTDKAYEELPNVDPLLHFLAARIEWEKLFEKSKDNELKVSPQSATAATNPKSFGQQIPLPTVTKPDQLILHCLEFADGEDERIQQSSVLTSEKLSTSGSQTAILNLQITLSNDSNAEYDQHPTLTEPSVRNGNSLGYSGEYHTETRNITERKAERCLKTIGKDYEAVLDGETNKTAPIAENLGLKDALQTGSKELNQVFANTLDTCGLISKNGLHHTLYEVSSCPGPQPSKNSMQEGLLCVLPWHKQPPGGEQRGIPQSPNSHNYKATTKYVAQLANVQSDKKVKVSDRLAEVKFLNESHGTGGIHTGNSMCHTKSEGEYPNTLSGNLCEEIVLKKKNRKKSALKAQDKNMKGLKPHSMKINSLKQDSKVTSNYNVSSNLQHADGESHVNKVTATENNNDKGGLDNRMPNHEGVTFLRSRQHKHIKKGSSVQLTGETKGTFGPDNKVRTSLRKQGRPNNEALAVVHTATPENYVPHVEICSTDGSKNKIQGGGCSTGNLTSLYEGRIGAFISCKRQIAQVASVLSSEASLSKSSRLSKLLTKAVTSLNKAYERVSKSSEIVKRIGTRMSQSSLPKSYQSNCNTFWESCDVDGHQYHKRHQYRSVRETHPKNSELNKQKQMKRSEVPHKCCEQLCKCVQSADFKRQPKKNEQTTCVEKSSRAAKVELASVTSTAEATTNSVRFQNTTKKLHSHCVITQRNCAQIMHSNPNHAQEYKSCEANLSINVFEKTEPPIVDSQAEPTSVKSPAESHLVTAEVMDLPAEPKPLEIPSKSKLEESQMELHIDFPAHRLCVGEETQIETVLEFPVDCLIVESYVDSQMAKFLTKSHKVKIPLASQTVESLGESQLLEPSIELQRTETQFENQRLQSQCEIKATKSSAQDQPAYSKRGGSGHW